MKHLLLILIYFVIPVSSIANTHKENYQLYKDSILMVAGRQTGIEREYGTGFVVLDGYHVLTDYHVIQGAKKINIFLMNEEIEYDSIVKTDEKSDLALLKIKRKLKPLPLVSRAPELVDELTCISYGGGSSLSVTTGILNRYTTLRGDTVIQTDVPICPGSSGAPIINQKGEAIGIILGIVNKPNFQSCNLAYPLYRSKFLYPEN